MKSLWGKYGRALCNFHCNVLVNEMNYGNFHFFWPVWLSHAHCVLFEKISSPLFLTVKTVAITFSTWDMDPHRWLRCEWVQMLVFVSVPGPEFKLQYHYSILLFLIHYLLLCHPFKVLSISLLLTMVLKLMSLVSSDLRLKTQFLKVSEIEIQVLNLKNWDISDCWP